MLAAAVVAVAVVVLVHRGDSSVCGASKVAHPRNPLLDTTKMQQQPDERLDRLAAAVDAMPTPFGPVRAGVGFNYDQYVRAYGVTGGVLTWTKNNAPVTMLDESTLTPRWSLRPTSKRTAWDASPDRFLLLDLDAAKGTRVASYGLSSGTRRWCTDLGIAQADGDPVATTFLAGGDVVVALPAEGGGITLTRLAASSGHRLWRRTLATAGRADYLGPLDDTTFLVGGTEDFRLAPSPPVSPDTATITAVRAEDGSTAWTWSGGASTLAHVVGVAEGRVLVTQRTTSGTELLALDDEDGSVLWRVHPHDLAHEATLRGGTVVMRTAAGLDGYGARDGALLWRYPVATDHTFFPYGFTLASMPSLDADHVLVPTTTSLLVLDVRDASTTSYALPDDGIRTTFWPYQLLVTPSLLGVVTNTGGVIAERE